MAMARAWPYYKRRMYQAGTARIWRRNIRTASNRRSKNCVLCGLYLSDVRSESVRGSTFCNSCSRHLLRLSAFSENIQPRRNAFAGILHSQALISINRFFEERETGSARPRMFEADNDSRFFFLVCVCILCIEGLRIGRFLILICQLSCHDLI